jgi:16S rRNA (guanine966-N2)-methyltransferase
MRHSGKGVTGKGQARPQQAHQVRIIGGQWKRTPLPVLHAEGLRPTPDRVRETVFNWLNHLLGNDWDGLRCLDLFAGSGALGFEAASRGAAHVTCIENHPAVVRHLNDARQKLSATQVQVVGGDVLLTMRKLIANDGNSALFDVIFVDPPYHNGWLDKVMPLCGQLLSETGLIYVEAEMPLTGESVPAWMDSWDVVRADKAGMVFYHVLQRKELPKMGHNARSV